MTTNHMTTRCEWCGSDPLYIEYHDREWGLPNHHDQHLFEMLILEGAQAGLSWLTILKKRQNYRAAFDNFDPTRVAAYTDQDRARLLDNPGIVRNRLKIDAAIRNARAVLQIQEQYGSLDAFLWRYVEGTPIQNHRKTIRDLPVQSPQSQAVSKDLRQLNCNFVGPTICYAFMQAVGMVNDHITSCFRHHECAEAATACSKAKE